MEDPLGLVLLMKNDGKVDVHLGHLVEIRTNRPAGIDILYADASIYENLGPLVTTFKLVHDANVDSGYNWSKLARSFVSLKWHMRWKKLKEKLNIGLKEEKDGRYE